LFSSSIGNPPPTDTIEITLFGPGKGESILLFIPGIGWGVIDSCTVEREGETFVPPLEYLKMFSVQELAFCILTHLHEDHFLGMEQILSFFRGRIGKVCRYAGDGVRELESYWAKELHYGRPIFYKARAVFHAFQEAKDAGAWSIRLSDNVVIFDGQCHLSDGQQFGVIIKALSPTAESVRRYTELLQKNVRVGELVPPKLPDMQHNLVSSALWISAGSLKLLLGSDVEIGSDEQVGWRGIVNNPNRPDLRINTLKVAHHGSRNAHYDPAWTLHSHENLTSIIAPFSGVYPPLPTTTQLERIQRLSRRVGIASESKFDNPDRYYPRETVKRMSGRTRNWKVKRRDNDFGFLRLRYTIDGGLIEETAIRSALWLEGMRQGFART
jgi:hypothetical protein